jgi:enoyl-CoA hydratase/carnithine racemase
MSTPEIIVADEGPVRTIRMNRPEKKNALTTAMYTAFAEAIRVADGDPGVRVMLIEGAGDAFTAGNDLQDFLAHAQQDGPRPVLDFLQVFSHAAKPIVAAVHGVAVGVGTTMLAHCDLVYAAEGARFSMPFVNLGLCPENASSFLLPSICGYQRAAELLMFGDAFDAAKAREVGLVNAVVPLAELGATAAAAAQKLATKPPASLRLTKRLLRRAWMPEIEAALDAESKAFAERLSSPEAKEAFTAFFEKRAPDFSRFG